MELYLQYGTNSVIDNTPIIMKILGLTKGLHGMFLNRFPRKELEKYLERLTHQGK